jgi:hypothetical protein
MGRVLIDWNPRNLYRILFRGDHVAMEQFLSEVCTSAWNLQQDAGRPWAEAVAVLEEVLVSSELDLISVVNTAIAALHDTPRFSYPCQLLGAKSSRSCGMDRNSC